MLVPAYEAGLRACFRCSEKMVRCHEDSPCFNMALRVGVIAFSMIGATALSSMYIDNVLLYVFVGFMTSIVVLGLCEALIEVFRGCAGKHPRVD